MFDLKPPKNGGRIGWKRLLSDEERRAHWNVFQKLLRRREPYDRDAVLRQIGRGDIADYLNDLGIPNYTRGAKAPRVCVCGKPAPRTGTCRSCGCIIHKNPKFAELTAAQRDLYREFRKHGIPMGESLEGARRGAK